MKTLGIITVLLFITACSSTNRSSNTEIHATSRGEGTTIGISNNTGSPHAYGSIRAGISH